MKSKETWKKIMHDMWGYLWNKNVKRIKVWLAKWEVQGAIAFLFQLVHGFGPTSWVVVDFLDRRQ